MSERDSHEAAILNGRGGTQIWETQWAGDLRTAILSDYSRTLSAFAAEGWAFETLSRVNYKVDIDGREVLLRAVVRSVEGAQVDGAIIVIDRDFAAAPPPDDANSAQLWTWLVENEDVKIIPFDVKYVSIGGVEQRDGKYYQWSRFLLGRVHGSQFKMVEFVVFVFQGDAEHLGIMPREACAELSEWSYGMDCMIDGPLWRPVCMVNVADLADAFVSLVRAHLGEQAYRNPTNRVTFHDWRPRARERSAIASPAGEMHSISWKKVLSLREEIIRRGWIFDFNPVAPYFGDFRMQLDVPGAGKLLVEHKFSDGNWRKSFLSSCLIKTRDPRRSAFARHRLWDVLWIDCADGIVCITRDEVGDGSESQAHALLVSNRFDNHDAAFDHIARHAAAARAAVSTAIRSLEPRDLTEGVLQPDPERRRTFHEQDPQHDPISGKVGTQYGLPGITVDVNGWCCRERSGIAFSLGLGHPVADAIVVQHKWTEAEVRAFEAGGRLPHHLWSKEISQRRAVPLRLWDVSLPKNVLPIEWPFAIRREFWTKPLAAPKFLTLGALLKPGLQSTTDMNRSQYLVLPSQFLSIYDGGQIRELAGIDKRGTGAQVFQLQRLEDRQITDPPFPEFKSATTFSPRFLSKQERKGAGAVHLARYLLRFADGSVYREIMRVLNSEGRIRVENGAIKAKNELFEAEAYHTTPGKVLQAAWDYGYIRYNIKHPK